LVFGERFSPFLAARRGFAAASAVLPRARLATGFFLGERLALIFRAFLANAETVSHGLTGTDRELFCSLEPTKAASLTTLPALPARLLGLCGVYGCILRSRQNTFVFFVHVFSPLEAS
jgi:hypothetical protein